MRQWLKLVGVVSFYLEESIVRQWLKGKKINIIVGHIQT